MTAVLVALVVCGSSLGALVLVLRFYERRDVTKAVSLSANVADELTKKLKSAEDRLSKIEMGRALGGR